MPSCYTGIEMPVFSSVKNGERQAFDVKYYLSLFIQSYKLRNKCDPINLIFSLIILFWFITDDAVEKNELKLDLEIDTEITKVISSHFVFVIENTPTTFYNCICGFVTDNEKFYKELQSYEKVWNYIYECFIDYHFSSRIQAEQILFFDFAIQHILRIAHIFHKPHGHTVIVCVEGTGWKAFTKFTPFVTGSKIAEIEVIDYYTIDNFKKDLMNFYTKCGISSRSYPKKRAK